jgi:PiT family inorganic phosphate transporter
VDPTFIILVFLVVVALAFDFLNGLHDAANSIATIVSTRVLSAKWAVLWAAFFNFIAFLFFGLHVAKMVGSGIIFPEIISDRVIFAALMGAISWNLLTWWLGHSLELARPDRRLVGASVAKVGGFGAVQWAGLGKTAAGIIVSPTVGFLLALVLVLIVSWTFLKSSPFFADRIFRKLQFVSAAPTRWATAAMTRRRPWASSPPCCSRTAPPARRARSRSGWCWHARPRWALGTLFGGWRIVHTMGSKITRLTPMQGFCAETGGAITLFLATISAFRSRRLTRSRALLSASAPRVAFRPCAGAWPRISSPRGS